MKRNSKQQNETIRIWSGECCSHSQVHASTSIGLAGVFTWIKCFVVNKLRGTLVYCLTIFHLFSGYLLLHRRNIQNVMHNKLIQCGNRSKDHNTFSAKYLNAYEDWIHTHTQNASEQWTSRIGYFSLYFTTTKIFVFLSFNFSNCSYKNKSSANLHKWNERARFHIHTHTTCNIYVHSATAYIWLNIDCSWMLDNIANSLVFYCYNVVIYCYTIVNRIIWTAS